MKKQAYVVMNDIEDKHWWFKARRNILENIMNIYVNKDISILDIGSGTGGNFKLLDKFGKCIGIEYNADAVKFSQEKFPNKTIKQGYLPNNLNVADEKFDLITLFDVLEHVDKDEEALYNIKRNLKDDGKIIITVPAFQFLWSKSDEAVSHKRRYTRKQLRYIVEKAGYRIDYISYFNSILFLPTLVGKMLVKVKKNYNECEEMQIKSEELNKLLYNVFSLEKNIIPKMKFPFGISIVTVISNNKV